MSITSARLSVRQRDRVLADVPEDRRPADSDGLRHLSQAPALPLRVARWLAEPRQHPADRRCLPLPAPLWRSPPRRSRPSTPGETGRCQMAAITNKNSAMNQPGMPVNGISLSDRRRR
jgi:hypothetical protein